MITFEVHGLRELEKALIAIAQQVAVSDAALIPNT